MFILRTRAAVQQHCERIRHIGQTLALVPTMGALHNGHRTLIQRAQERADYVFVSVFVNPAQFNDDDDFKRYPRQEQQDFEYLRQQAVYAVFAPGVDEMYSPNDKHETPILPEMHLDILCGKYRPGHFEGVLQIVSKLLEIFDPSVLILGEKDYQQLILIRQLAQKRYTTVRVLGVATEREASGLACSSRNCLLSQTQRQDIAPLLYQTLLQFRTTLQQGGIIAPAQVAAMAKLESFGFKVEYLEVRSPQDLSLLPVNAAVPAPAVALVAAWLGQTRLIDNVSVHTKINTLHA